MNWQVERVTADETKPVRHAVLWPHLPSVEACVIAEDERADTIHLGVFRCGVERGDRELVGVCSLFAQRSVRFPEALPANAGLCRLRVMGTLNSVRGQGAGAALVEGAVEAARTAGAEYVWCDAREVALGFYEKLDFKFVSQAYDVPKIGSHRMMARRL